jgi:hypothetical protein
MSLHRATAWECHGACREETTGVRACLFRKCMWEGRASPHPPTLSVGRVGRLLGCPRRPIYDPGNCDPDGKPTGDNAKLQAAIEDLLYKYEVDLFFAGEGRAWRMRLLAGVCKCGWATASLV